MDIGRLATQLAAGVITSETIVAIYGDDVLVQVLAYALGAGSATAAGAAYDVADDLLDGTLGEIGDTVGELFDFF